MVRTYECSMCDKELTEMLLEDGSVDQPFMLLHLADGDIPFCWECYYSLAEHLTAVAKGVFSVAGQI